MRKQAMKIVVGLDYLEEGPDGTEAAATLPLLKELHFPAAEIEMLHVVAPCGVPDHGLQMLLFAVGEPVEPDYVAERAAAQNMVDRVVDRFGGFFGSDGTVRGLILAGKVSARLMDRADSTHAALIAIDGSPQHSILDTFLTASVARDVVVSARQSVLIARNRPAGAVGATSRRASGGLRAVLATDHSSYADRCVELLGRFAPAGIEHLDVLAAYPAQQLRRRRTLAGDLAIDPVEAIHDHLARRNDRVIDVLSHHLAGTTFSSHVIAAPVQSAIDQRMMEADADLLILGARGHGFVERILLGSVSFHYAIVNLPYSVLILRA